MRAGVKRWWSVGKLLLALALLYFIGRRFWIDLQEPGLWDRSFRPGWMVLSGVLYLLALSLWALVWNILLGGLGQHLSAPVTLRAYFVGQLGKYLPGKAWALVMRATLAAGPGVSAGLAGLTAFYEVLVDMAAGALLGAVLIFALGPDVPGPVDWHALGGLFRLETPPEGVDRRVFALLSLILFVPLILIIVPPIFNRLADRLSQPFREKDSPPLPQFHWGLLGRGLLMGAASWFLLGAAVWAMLRGVLTRPPAWDLHTWGLYTGYTCLAYVAGFAILIVPSGLGVREFFLTLLLVAGEGLPRAAVLLAVLVLRLVWTTAELLLTGTLYWLPRWGASKKEERVSGQ